MDFHGVTFHKLLLNFVAEDASYLWKIKIQANAKLAAKLQIIMLDGTQYTTRGEKLPSYKIYSLQ